MVRQIRCLASTWKVTGLMQLSLQTCRQAHLIFTFMVTALPATRLAVINLRSALKAMEATAPPQTGSAGEHLFGRKVSSTCNSLTSVFHLDSPFLSRWK